MITKLTLALVAIITGSAFAAIPADLPEFKNEKQLAEWRAEMAVKNAATTTASVDHAFYTGKPYIETSTGGYAFKYRSYNPELARWTSEDPSGFPDGANGNGYLAVPTSEFDYQGLLVVAEYSITKRTLTIDGTVYGSCSSGDNIYDNRFKQNGPIPTGEYEILSRGKGAATYNDHQAFILDPFDGTRYNDIWDGGQANGRYAFRIHTNVTTIGCIATSSIDAIAKQIWDSEHDKRKDIVQKAPIPDPESFLSEWILGKLKVVE